jgi:spore maturation protein CgeB
VKTDPVQGDVLSGAIDASPAVPPRDYYDQDDSENRCFLCGRPEYRLVHEVVHFGFPFRFQRCRCGMVKQTPMPNVKFFEWFFNSEVFFSARRTGKEHIWGFYDYFADEPCRMATSRHRFRRLRRHFEGLARARMLKIGPSTGTFLKVALDHGHDAMGCDVSSRFVGYARDHYGVRIDNGRFERLGYPAGGFDAVLLFNVIENVPNQAEFLSEVNRVLPKGGLFILNFVDMKGNWLARLQGSRYFLFRPPICYVFDRDVMVRTLAAFGFEPVEWQRDWRYLHLEKISTLLGWRWLHWLARALRLHRVMFPIYAYPSRIVVATKVGDVPARGP